VAAVRSRTRHPPGAGGCLPLAPITVLLFVQSWPPLPSLNPSSLVLGLIEESSVRECKILVRIDQEDIYRFLLAKARDISDFPESAAVSSVSRPSDTRQR